MAEQGRPPQQSIGFPLIYQGETVGQLVLAPCSPEEAFSASDLRLLKDLVRQVGVVAHAVRLTGDLQRTRERLVTTREEERRRLRRDLHDGVGPQLAALTLRLEAARNGLVHDSQTRNLLADLAQHVRNAVADIRRSVYALRPPALDELGPVPALRETAAQYSHSGLSITVEAPDELPPLPAAVEVAAYRIVQEAMTNAARHAGAGHCAIRISRDEEGQVMHLEVVDAGHGIRESSSAGVGLSSMRERAEELGGVFKVEAHKTAGLGSWRTLAVPSEWPAAKALTF